MAGLWKAEKYEGHSCPQYNAMNGVSIRLLTYKPSHKWLGYYTLYVFSIITTMLKCHLD
ncbi:MAG: hypothetical protein HZA48_00780 [Planctomycetes bacterium]|nr:hypothetical protein [Planctomycetota bacterium]